MGPGTGVEDVGIGAKVVSGMIDRFPGDSALTIVASIRRRFLCIGVLDPAQICAC